MPKKGPPFRQFERPRFFAGKLLTADDLQAEQDYFRGKLRLHNRFLHGWGIVTGLGVTVDQGTTVAVSPGLALDCAGNELVLSAAEQISHHLTQDEEYGSHNCLAKSSTPPVRIPGMRVSIAVIAEA